MKNLPLVLTAALAIASASVAHGAVKSVVCTRERNRALIEKAAKAAQ
jgi:hypothetical protein